MFNPYRRLREECKNKIPVMIRNAICEAIPRCHSYIPPDYETAEGTETKYFSPCAYWETTLWLKSQAHINKIVDMAMVDIVEDTREFTSLRRLVSPQIAYVHEVRVSLEKNREWYRPLIRFYNPAGSWGLQVEVYYNIYTRRERIVLDREMGEIIKGVCEPYIEKPQEEPSPCCENKARGIVIYR